MLETHPSIRVKSISLTRLQERIQVLNGIYCSGLASSIHRAAES
jgi:hypothetical protein